MKKTPYCLALILILTSLLFIGTPLFASDKDVETSVQQSYNFKTYLKGDDITVKSKDGVVTLTGTVSEESHKLLAEETVASQPGIKSVKNQLKIKDEAPAEFSNAWLVAKVKTTLLFHRNVDAVATKVSVDDGTVTLRGKTVNEAQKELTTEYAKDVEGVKAVNNEMTVSAAAMKPGEKSMGVKIDTLGESIDDASITALVKTTLFYHRSTSALNTTVKTEKGVVNLGGTAKNAAEKDLATKLVMDVQGVKKVINTMAIQDN